MRKKNIRKLKGKKQAYRRKKKVKRSLSLRLARILFWVLIITMAFKFVRSKRDKMAGQRDRLMPMWEFERGSAIYDNLLYSRSLPTIVTKMDSIIQLAQIDGEHKKIIEEMKARERSTVRQAEELIQDDNLNEAKKIVDDYLTAFPESIGMNKVKDSLDEKYSKVNKEAKRIASEIKGSNKTINYKEANLRQSPTFDSKVLDVLTHGTKVYIYNTEIEFPDIIWCEVKVQGYHYSAVGWVSFDTMN